MKASWKVWIACWMSVVLAVTGLFPGLGRLPAVKAASNVYVQINYDESAIAKNSKLYNGTTYTGTIGGAWGIYSSAANTDYVMMENAPGRSDYSLKIVSNTTNINTGRNNLGGNTAGNTGVGGKLVFETTVYMNSTQHRRDIQFRSLNAPVPATATTNVSVISFDNAGKIKDAGNQTIGTYEANAWYRLKLFVDNDARTVTYFINGVYAGEAALPAAWLNVRHIYLYQYYKSGVQGEWYVDDLKLADYVPVTGLAVSPATLELAETEQTTIAASPLPDNASEARLTWSIDDPTVASVVYGVVHALKAGTATVTVSTYGGGYSQSVPLTVVAPIPLNAITLPGEVSLPATTMRRLEPAFVPVNATNRKVNWQSSNPAIATVDANGVITGLAAGSADITAISEANPAITGVTKVTITPYIDVERVTIENAPAQLMKYETFTLAAVVSPSGATAPELTWQSDHPGVLAVDGNGRLTAVGVGTAAVTARASNGQSDTVTIQVTTPQPQDPQEYDKLRIRWEQTFTGMDALDVGNAEVKAIVDASAAQAQSYWDTMQLSGSGGTLWADLPASTTDSTFVTDHYTRLKAMAKSYALRGTALYHNDALKADIIQAMDWMLAHLYTPTGAEFGNWWNWDIGAPTRLADILVFMYDDLTPQQIAANALSIDHYIGDVAAPSFTQAGANRSDIMMIETRLGIVEKNYDRLIKARDGLTPLFDYVTSGDGFYEDGSYIQHNNIAYSGSYGEVLMQGMGNLLLLLNGSTWQPVVPGVDNVYRWIKEGFAPILYKGQALDMTRGRAIVRGNASDGYASAKSILIGMARVAQTAPPDKAEALKRFIKFHIPYLLERGMTYYQFPLDLADMIKGWMADPSIVPSEQLPQHVEMNAMARSIHVGDDYLFGISKSSKRIATYELTNGENPKGWYTGDGMTYLYNNDLRQYTDNYWQTVDWYKLPGTTVVDRPRSSDQYQYGDGEMAPSNAWAGGASLGSYGVSGMNLKQIGTQMSANKSWFMFDDEIVALGSGITSTDHLPVESIVEQRKLKADNSNAFIVDGEAKSGEIAEQAVAHPSWMYLEGNVQGAGIGYTFPDHQSVTIARKRQEGRLSDVELSDPPSSTPQTDLLSNYFVTMWINHGADPVNQSYAYAILPNATQGKTAAYSASPDYDIVLNSPDAQAVRERKLGVTGYNFWRDQLTTAGDVTSNHQASVMVKEDPYAGRYELAVADPTLENSGTIELELNRSAEAVIAKDDAIQVTQLTPTVRIRANVKGTLGKSLRLTLQTTPVLPEQPELPQGIEEDSSGGGSTPVSSSNVPYLVEDGKASIHLGQGENTASVALSGLPSVPLEVSADGISVTLPAASVQAFKQTAAQSAKLKLDIDVRQAADAALLSAPAADSSAVLTRSGPGVTVGLQLREENGTAVEGPAWPTAANVTIPVSEASLDAELLGVYRYDEAAEQWMFAGDEVEIANGRAAFAIDRPGTYAVMAYDKSFVDVPSGHWAHRALQVLAAKHIVDGVSQMAFDPSGTTTRAQFTAMLVRALHLPELQAGAGFADVSAEAWYASAVAAASRAGLISGVTEQTFSPDALITREQMAVLLVRAYAYHGGVVPAGLAERSGYTDRTDMSIWAQEAIDGASALGLLSGTAADTFSPKEALDRIQSVQAIYNLLQVSGK
ncbi:polysaccharide lyase family 8 super-sandwich domain-containing protein [Paenibacillus ferrarius]|uniref:polysaccharide lyase family 8 super-sandwich domain-containing protein n=1 Tax=Paenibacillus ferrarius TaxID=1469647 RepID=UPI003D2CB5A7